MLLSVFDMAQNILDVRNDTMPNILVVFSSSEHTDASKKVLQQLSFFKCVADPDLTVYCFDQDRVPNPCIFTFLYSRLKKAYLKHKTGPLSLDPIEGIDAFELTDPDDQFSYLELIKYLTKPTERTDLQLLRNVRWHRMLWIKLVESRFENMDDFFSLDERILGYYCYVRILGPKYEELEFLAKMIKIVYKPMMSTSLDKCNLVDNPFLSKCIILPHLKKDTTYSCEIINLISELDVFFKIK